MPLKLTQEFQQLLGDKVTQIETDVPMKAMDTIRMDDNHIVISPNSDGKYRVELWKGEKRVRAMAVVPEQDSIDSPFPSPQKYLGAVRV